MVYLFLNWLSDVNIKNIFTEKELVIIILTKKQLKKNSHGETQRIHRVTQRNFLYIYL